MGRPRKKGERYPSGKLKPTGDPVAPAAWDRVRRFVAKIMNDPKLASELSRLAWHKEISWSEMLAGFKLAEIYGRFERLNGYSRSARSAAYDAGFREGGAAIADESLPPEVLQKKIDMERSFVDAFTTVQAALTDYPVKVRDAVETLCVDNLNIGPILLQDVRPVLRELTRVFGVTTRGQNAKDIPAVPRPIIVKSERVDSDRIAFHAYISTVRPDYDAAERDAAYEIHLAMRDRERFRATKLRRAR